MNYYRHNGERYNPEEYYANTYSLWQNSQYYDTSNLSPQKNWGEALAACPCDIEEPCVELRDGKNRKIVTRDALYRDPELFYKQNYMHSQNQQQGEAAAGYDWTQQSWPAWQKATDVTSAPLRGTSRQTRGKRTQMLKNLVKRPEMSKAASMMQKMGWEGGALGKSGDGIVEPITPNEVYATTTMGFGQEEAAPKTQETDEKPESDDKYFKDYYNTNVLLYILQFVKNDKEIELVFDYTLFKNERKRIHGLVNDLINGDELSVVNYDSVAQMDIVKEIYDHNCYVLSTQSEGENPKRQLCIYKEAPPNVYLITPDDLKDDEIDDQPDDQPEEVKVDVNPEIVDKNDDGVPKDEETNPFLKSITRNLENEKGPEASEEKSDENILDKLEECNLEGGKVTPTLLDKIIGFFKEFAEKEEFTDFRFLGQFSALEIDAITQFMNHVNMCIKKPEDTQDEINKQLLEVFKENPIFEVYQDCNDATVINKPKKESPT